MTVESRSTDDGPAEGGGPTVLHVEPDARSAELMVAFAERYADGFTVRSVGGMAAALDAADAADCVVTEQRLPDGSGVELVQRLRERGSDVPVVFHTTCRDAKAEVAALDAGPDAYFSKRSKRSQYDRVLERIRGLLGDGAGRSCSPATTSRTTPRSAGETAGSDE